MGERPNNYAPGQVWRSRLNGTEREFIWTDGRETIWRRPGSDRHEWCKFSTWQAWARGATLVRTSTTGFESWAEGHPGSPDATRHGGVSRPLRSDARATEVRDGNG